MRIDSLPSRASLPADKQARLSNDPLVRIEFHVERRLGDLEA
jgi:hypothetical protein